VVKRHCALPLRMHVSLDVYYAENETCDYDMAYSIPPFVKWCIITLSESSFKLFFFALRTAPRASGTQE